MKAKLNSFVTVKASDTNIIRYIPFVGGLQLADGNGGWINLNSTDYNTSTVLFGYQFSSPQIRVTWYTAPALIKLGYIEGIDSINNLPANTLPIKDTNPNLPQGGFVAGGLGLDTKGIGDFTGTIKTASISGAVIAVAIAVGIGIYFLKR